VLGVAPDDEAVLGWARAGWLDVHGGGRWSTVLTFHTRPEPAAAWSAMRACLARDAAWVAEHCEPNVLGDPRELFGDPQEIPRRARVRGECRARVARMEIALLLYAYAIEPSDSQRARRAREGARGLGWMQALVGDPEALDYRTAATHAEMRENMRALATAAGADEDIEQPLTVTIRSYIEAARGSLLPRQRRSS